MGCCFAPDCSHTNKNGCKMFEFPVDENQKIAWEKLIRRADRKANRHSVVCSCHFKNGLKENAPTLFKRNQGKLFSYSLPENKRRTVKPKAIVLQDLENLQPGTSSNVETPIAQPSQSSTSCVVESENYFLKREVEELKAKLTNLTLSFSFDAIKDNDALIAMYTGLPDRSILMCLFDSLEHIKIRYYAKWVDKISRRDQVLMTLMKLRLNFPNRDLAVRFNCSCSTLSNVILTWVHVLHAALFIKFIKHNVPTRQKNRTCLPSAFAPFTNCRMILDCTEVYTAVPEQLNKQRYTWSNYKHRNTLKGLIGVAPNGVITFVSDLYVGSTSDKKIVENCGVLSVFEPGDLILADKGFLISDILPAGVSLNIPPFLMTAQFSPDEVQQTTTIAKARIHVERAIERIKLYKILSFIPATLRPFSSKVFQVCASLTTLQYPLIKEVEGNMRSCD